MKGRARQQCAKFYVFANSSANEPLSLSNAQAAERIVHQFITQREDEYKREFNASPNNFTDCEEVECAEEEAMHNEEYKTHMSSVDISSSKSLLNRYALSVPIDPSCRTSKQAILREYNRPIVVIKCCHNSHFLSVHMPLYKENSLILPAHIPPDARVIKLPVLFHGEPKRKKHSLMALAACVRLHKFGLLNDRLLPLSDSDMKHWLVEKALNKLSPCKVIPPIAFNRSKKVHLYKLTQSGQRFSNEEMSITSGNRRLSLALISPSLLPRDLPSISFVHNELHSIECNVIYLGTIELSDLEWATLTDFHSALQNVRWRRKTKSRWFSFDEKLLSETRNPYVVGCLDEKDKLDWEHIDVILDEFSRSLDARKLAVEEYSTMASPRICCPTYSPNTLYILYESSGKTCQDQFATSEYTNFKQYYHDKYCIKVNPNGALYRARRLWEFPNSSVSGSNMTKEICTVDIPQELCVESIIADPLLMLHSLILPQILFQLEQYLNVNSFIQHTLQNYPISGQCLSAMPIDLVAQALTAKSCSSDESYDRLEWLGDAVLKLMHTDALLKWRRTSYLHEGYLTMLRSGEFSCILFVSINLDSALVFVVTKKLWAATSDCTIAQRPRAFPTSYY